jgi:hypothetical protein
LDAVYAEIFVNAQEAQKPNQPWTLAVQDFLENDQDLEGQKRNQQARTASTSLKASTYASLKGIHVTKAKVTVCIHVTKAREKHPRHEK